MEEIPTLKSLTKKSSQRPKSKEIVIRISGSLKRLQECKTLDIYKIQKVILNINYLAPDHQVDVEIPKESLK